MLTLADLVKRYPAMVGMSQDLFEVHQSDANLIMGTDESRWLNFYVPAQAALIAHMAVLSDSLEEDDAPMPALPVSRTDVDDVQVEFSDRMISEIPYIEASWYSSVYGQHYVMWRRMAFGGPRVA